MTKVYLLKRKQYKRQCHIVSMGRFQNIIFKKYVLPFLGYANSNNYKIMN